MPRTIDTARLHLRPPARADAAAVFAYAGDPRATRLMIWPTANTLADAQDFLDDMAAGWADGDDFCYLVADRASGRVYGAASCQFDEHGAEIGFIVASRFWGRGLAPEAAAAVTAAAWAIDDLHRIWATCDTENRRSVRVLEKLGMRYEGRLARWAACPNTGEAAPRDAFCYALTR